MRTPKNRNHTLQAARLVLALLLFALAGCADTDNRNISLDYDGDTQYATSLLYLNLGQWAQSEVNHSTAQLLENLYNEESLTSNGKFYEYGSKLYERVVCTNNYVVEDTTDLDFYYFTTYKVGSVHWFEVSPIVWRLLNIQNGYAVLVSENCIDAMSFTDEGVEKGWLWENSNIREWLNNEFYKNAFTSAEQSMIVTHNSPCFYISNPGRVKYEREFVQDKVRLLEWREARLSQHFADDSARLAQVTDYAAAKGGARVNEVAITERYGEDVANYKEFLGCGIYWLQDTEYNSNNVYIVYEFGFTMSYKPYVKNRTVRPVIVCNYSQIRGNLFSK